MFRNTQRGTLISMSQTSWIDVDMNELPTGTVTLLLADVEGSTRLWDTDPDAIRDAIKRLDSVLAVVVPKHNGVRPIEQGEGDSFVVAFIRAADAIGCALELQHAPLAPIKLRIGIHSGDIHLRDEGNYIGPTINRAARLRDLGHGGQTVVSGATEPLVAEQLPPDVTLIDLGSHRLRDLPRPERVWQLCHPDLHIDFPPLRTVDSAVAERLPAQLTSFIGRETEIASVREALVQHRLVTLTGAGGAGKTRLAVRVATDVALDHRDGIWYVDLAPITEPALVPVTVAHTVGLPDQPGLPATDRLLRFIRDRAMLLVLDNCEHLLDAVADVVTELLAGCPAVVLLTTSREPLGVAGEVCRRIPSLSLADEAIQLFTDRARRTTPGFQLTTDNAATVTEICRRLDGMPLAIELAAARVRALSPAEILDSLHDRFRLLTGGARTAVRRQQTLRASMDWSYALLTEPEQTLFGRLAVFVGGFDLDAARAVAGGDAVEYYQVLDQLTLLVDKSLVVAEGSRGGTRYRLLETVRQYAQERLAESGDSDAVRDRHRDHYSSHILELDWATTEIDNLRAAFAWCRERSHTDLALALASSLEPLWLTRGRLQEGLNWLDAALGDAGEDAHSGPSARALVSKTLLLAFLGRADVLDDAERGLAAARELADPALLARALAACGVIGAPRDPGLAQQQFAEAAAIAEELGELPTLAQIRSSEAISGLIAGEPLAAVRAAQDGLRIARAIGDGFVARQCLLSLGWAELLRGDLRDAIAHFDQLAESATAAGDSMYVLYTQELRAFTLSYTADVATARNAAEAAIQSAAELFEYYAGPTYAALGVVHLAEGDAAAARRVYQTAFERTGLDRQIASTFTWAPLAALGCGDTDTARRWADDIVEATMGSGHALALVGRARVAIALGDLDTADRDACDALEQATRLGSDLIAPFALDYLAMASDNPVYAARLFGAAEAARRRMGIARFKVFEAEDLDRIAAVRNTLGDNDFEGAWTEGEELPLAEAVTYALRGRGERRRAAIGWASLTRAELDVARLVSEGLGNKDVAARLFVSPRTVQAHLTHIYAKLGLSSRVQLAQEAARH